MKTEEHIDQLLKAKMDGFSPDAPDVWQAVQQGVQVAQGASASGVVAGKAGISLIGKVLIGSVLIGAIGTTVYFINNQNDNTLQDSAAVALVTVPVKPELEVQTTESNTELSNAEVKPKLVEHSTPKKDTQKDVPSTVVEQKDKPVVSLPEVNTPMQSNNTATIPAKTENKQPMDVSVSKSNTSNPNTPAKKVTEAVVPKLKEEPKTEKVYPELSITNVFTPNGDGSNDQFVIDIEEEDYYVLTITNKKGEIVFQSTDKTICWDGTDKMSGAELPEGTYFYIFQYSYKDTDNQFRKSGKIAIRK